MILLRFTRTEIQAYAFIAPSIIILCVLLVYPLGDVFRLSFYESSIWGDTFAGLANYRRLLADGTFWQAFRQTIIFVAGSVLCHFFIALGLALLLHQNINRLFRNFFRGLFILPWLISPTVAAMIWVLMYNPFGVLNGLLVSLGLMAEGQNLAWLGNPQTSLLAVTIVNIWRGFPFMLVMLLAGLQGIPEELYEAAMIDGANMWQRFIYITLPSLKGIIFTITVLDAIWTFRHFDLTFIMTGGGPVNSSEVLATSIYSHAFRNFDMGYASAQAITMLIILLILGMGYIRQIGKEG